MIDMKMTKKDKKQYGGIPVTDSTDGPDYPYGLRISLDSASLEKLGLSAEDFRKVKSVSITAKADVSSFNIGKYDGKETGEVSLQITAITIDGVKMTKGKSFFAENSKGPGE